MCDHQEFSQILLLAHSLTHRHATEPLNCNRKFRSLVIRQNSEPVGVDDLLPSRFDSAPNSCFSL